MYMLGDLNGITEDKNEIGRKIFSVINTNQLWMMMPTAEGKELT